jgi:hypothetical protein
MFFYKIDETWKGLPVLNLELHYRKKYKKDLQLGRVGVPFKRRVHKNNLILDSVLNFSGRYAEMAMNREIFCSHAAKMFG